MRDIVITLIVFASLPYAFKKPYIGVLMWVWLSVMNPHRLSWGFAYSFPFAAIVAGVTLIALVLDKEKKKLPAGNAGWLLLAFTIWMAIGTAFAIHVPESFVMLQRVLKIMLMTFVAMLLIRNKEQLHWFLWVLAGSLAYYGVKGGVFTIATGGNFRVWGPDGSFINGNNEVALALVVIIPILYYLYQVAGNKWVGRGLLVSMPLCLFAALGSYSRGALLAVLAMSAFLWLKSPKKIAMGVVIAIVLPIAIAFMPDQWSQRMDTINTYQEDSSAMGRINAWWMAFNLASDRPLTGGGFEIYDAGVFARYAPIPTDIHAAHSIYFQCLGEHGFIGLALYLAIVVSAWRRANWIKKHSARLPEFKWAGQLATMIQVSMVGFGVGGAFLSLLYFDVPYYLLAMLLVAGQLVQNELDRLARPQQPEPAQPAVALQRHY
jgi:probable O-glycosylation ligase (exosortase A-associated)